MKKNKKRLPNTRSFPYSVDIESAFVKDASLVFFQHGVTPALWVDGKHLFKSKSHFLKFLRSRDPRSGLKTVDNTLVPFLQLADKRLVHGDGWHAGVNGTVDKETYVKILTKVTLG